MEAFGELWFKETKKTHKSMDGSILHINITLNLLHEEDKRDTCRQGRRNVFFHLYFKICLLERLLLYIIGKVQWKMSARLCHFCVQCMLFQKFSTTH